jgi:hypothetical protein
MWAKITYFDIPHISGHCTNMCFRNSRRKDSHVLRVTERSNGLAFSHHHFLTASSSTRPQPSYSYILSQIDGNTSARPREKLTVTLKPVNEHLEEKIVLPFQQIRSLIPPITPGRAKTGPNTIRRRRNSSSSASIKSLTSSLQSRRQKSIMVPTPTLATMPVEILASICQYLPQQELHSLMLSNSNFSEVTAEYLYMEPRFASTYRFAQVSSQSSFPFSDCCVCVAACNPCPRIY